MPILNFELESFLFLFGCITIMYNYLLYFIRKNVMAAKLLILLQY